MKDYTFKNPVKINHPLADKIVSLVSLAKLLSLLEKIFRQKLLQSLQTIHMQSQT
jgi:hypothetical protein